MTDLRRLEGERVYCYECEHQWDRSQGGLTCPNCNGEFVEIRTDGARPENDLAVQTPWFSSSPPRNPPSRPVPIPDRNPWVNVPDPEEPDITTIEYNSGRNHGTFSFSRTITVNGSRRNFMNNTVIGGSRMINGDIVNNNIVSPNSAFPPMFGLNSFGFGNNLTEFGGNPTAGPIFPREHQPQQAGHMQDLFSMIFQTMQQAGPQQRQQNQQQNGAFNPFDLIYQVFNPANARQGDTVFSQEAFDRVITQLMEQTNGSTAPGPASETAIQSLPTRKVDKSMMGNDGKAECSICMDNVDIGEEVTNLPCDHWFHGECVKSWLKEHDTCPHCRKPITNSGDGGQQSRSSRRRTSRRPSSIGSPSIAGGSGQMPGQFPDTPSGVREARQQYYGIERDRNRGFERSNSHGQSRSHLDRRHSSRSDGRENDSNGNGSGGGWADWIRNHMHL